MFLCISTKIVSTVAIRNTPEYRAYQAAKSRCNKTNHPQYKYYGGRGILFLFENFENFFKEVGHKQTKTQSLDRINNNGHYEPGNVRWATKQEQTLNRNLQSNNKTGHKNIYWYKKTNKWNVHIKRNNKQYNLGYFHSLEDALSARNSFIKENQHVY